MRVFAQEKGREYSGVGCRDFDVMKSRSWKEDEDRVGRKGTWVLWIR